MSKHKLSLRTKALNKRLSRARLEDVPAHIWRLWTLSSDRSELVRGVLDFPEEFFNPRIDSEYKLHPWRLESLFTQFAIASAPSGNRYLVLENPNTTIDAVIWIMAFWSWITILQKDLCAA